MTSYPLRSIDAHEFETWARMITTTYGQDWRDGALRSAQTSIEPERTTAAFDGGQLIGGMSIYGRLLTVPDGYVPVAGVTLVAVLPTHRRRGLLTAMMRRQFTQLYESGGEPVAALNAAEATIYGRFGYGIASHLALLEGDTRFMALRPDVEAGDGSIRLLDAEAARPLLEKVYDTARRDTAGWVDRTDKYWTARLYDAEHVRGGGTALRFAVHTDAAGAVRGYVFYRSAGATVRVVELAATTRGSYAALWRYLIELDGHDHVSYEGATDEVLPHLLRDPRSVRRTVVDNLWVRLVDVGRALTARRYAGLVEVVFQVEDEFCGWNAGRYRLCADGDRVDWQPTRDRAELRLSATELGAAYLGGTTLAELAAAGLVEELRPGAVAAASRAFRADRDPFHPSGGAFPAF
ncbi:GNAT family N-acetyltransferase [Actinocatenispora sera]|uniref:GNAT family N-acetyltransferase n=1 Tax=Actinocatenispora sera TaxID=390989 RepID=UPI0033CD4FB5